MSSIRSVLALCFALPLAACSDPATPKPSGPTSLVPIEQQAAQAKKGEGQPPGMQAPSQPAQPIINVPADKGALAAEEQQKKLQAQLAAALEAKDPKERKRLLDEHLVGLNQALAALTRPDPPAAPAPTGMGPGAVIAPPDPNAPAQVAIRLRRLEHKLAMTQGLLQQMVERESARK